MKHNDTAIFIIFIAGFLLVYLILFLKPVYFNTNQMSYENLQPIPRLVPIGGDLTMTLGFSEKWFIHHKTAYVGSNAHPPLITLLYIPFLYLEPQRVYIIFTLFTLLAYIGFALLLPVLMRNREQSFPLVVLLFMTGLYSYGFSFVIERGQSDVITIFLCFLGIYMFHYHPKWRYLAYLFFTLSIQFKLSPAIFIFTFITDVKQWKENIIRFVSLGAINIALFFILGVEEFINFINAVRSKSLDPYVWVGNHSLSSFVQNLRININEYEKYGPIFTPLYQFVLTPFFVPFVFLIIISGFLLILWTMYRKQFSGLNSYLLLCCSLTACILPAESHDYKLPFLIAPMAIFLSTITSKGKNLRRQIFQNILIFIMSITYCSTLFAYTNKPLFIFGNNFPNLIIMFIVVIILMLINESKTA